jgi:hypothetical protein
MPSNSQSVSAVGIRPQQAATNRSADDRDHQAEAAGCNATRGNIDALLTVALGRLNGPDQVVIRMRTESRCNLIIAATSMSASMLSKRWNSMW